jgi:hypothetical protein
MKIVGKLTQDAKSETLLEAPMREVTSHSQTNEV